MLTATSSFLEIRLPIESLKLQQDPCLSWIQSFQALLSILLANLNFPLIPARFGWLWKLHRDGLVIDVACTLQF